MTMPDEIGEIRKEIIESHNLIIKTDNLIKNLSSDLKQIHKKQERYERKYIFNSVTAYIIFVVVIFGGLYVAFDAKTGVVVKEKERIEKDLELQKAEIVKLQKKISQRSQQDRIAERFLRLKKEDRNLDALKVAESLDSLQVSPLIDYLVTKEAEELRLKLAGDTMDAGKALFNKGLLSKALREFERAAEIKPPGALLAQIHLHRATVLQKLNRTAKAADSFLAAVDADPQSTFADFALFMAATTLETSGDVPRALDGYKRLIEEYTKSKHIHFARRRVEKLMRLGPPGSLPESLEQPDSKPVVKRTPVASPQVVETEEQPKEKPKEKIKVETGIQQQPAPSVPESSPLPTSDPETDEG